MKRLLVAPGEALLFALLTVACGSALGAQDAEWPLEIESDGAKVVIYQPQPESLRDDKLSARAAVSMQKAGQSEPMFGAVWIDARVSTDRDARTITILDLKVPKVKFPNATPAEEAEVAKVLQTELPKHHHTCSLDTLLTTLDQADVKQDSQAGLEHAPPKIVFATVPTVLVTIDGKPELQAVAGSEPHAVAKDGANDKSSIMRVVNTPFVMFFLPANKTYYLRTGERWARASDIFGPWQDDPNPPAEVVSALPPANYDKAAEAAAVNEPEPFKEMQILVVTQPTELIVSEGEPKWTPVEGNELLYLANSENDVFMEIATQQYYLLLAGRWYTSASLAKGPWSYVAADKLPPAFAQIPPGSTRSNVRTFVAGTDEARDAVLDASIPQTSVVARESAKCSVTYDGEPKFDKIAGTNMLYAINTPNSVLSIDNKFYCCQQGVWFTAADPNGPWTVCTSVPAEVHTIPASCPVYPVSYVYVYDSTPDSVYVGYLPGYTGCYVYGPTVVYGTGWWYPGWYGSLYYPHPCTWGFAPHYNPWTCGWSFGLGYGWGVGAGWFSLSFGWGHPGWWGPSGFHCNHFDIHGHTVRFHPAIPLPHEQRFHFNAVVTEAGHDNLYKRPENTARNLPLRTGGPAASRVHVSSSVPNNVFADRDGHVLRRTTSGWEEHQPGGWKPTDRVKPSEPTAGAPRPNVPPREGARPVTPPGNPPGNPTGTRPVTPPPREPERPINPPPREAPAPRETPAPRGVPPAPPSHVIPPRDDFEQMSRARELGSSRASGFQQRAGRAPAPVRPAQPPQRKP